MQDIDQVELMRPVTKWARSVLRTERIPDYVSTALRQSLSGRPGPVFLEVPDDIIWGEIAEDKVMQAGAPDDGGKPLGPVTDIAITEAMDGPVKGFTPPLRPSPAPV